MTASANRATVSSVEQECKSKLTFPHAEGFPNRSVEHQPIVPGLIMGNNGKLCPKVSVQLLALIYASTYMDDRIVELSPNNETAA